MNKFHMEREVVKILEDIFPDWRKTLPIDLHEVLRELAVQFSVQEIRDFVYHFNNAGSTWGFYPESNFVRIFLDRVVNLLTTLIFTGREHVDTALTKLVNNDIDRLIILSNHVSYGDANLIASAFSPLLKKHNCEQDFSVVVGPKVYNNKFKKFSSLHFNSLLIAQSRSVATGEASLGFREIARATRKVAEDIQKKVKVLLIFPEGSRSRSQKLKPFLPGVLRLMDLPGTIGILPVSVAGTENLLPINATKLDFSKIRLAVSKMQMLDDLKHTFNDHQDPKTAIMEHLGRTIAAVHPEERRGVYTS